MSDVFPAQAGVFPDFDDLIADYWGLPRASGGVSIRKIATKSSSMSSPRKRGCFSLSAEIEAITTVFPAQAGVFPSKPTQCPPAFRLPRASGGVSVPFFARTDADASSPRKRGCFQRSRPQRAEHRVFPAQAGVFLIMSLATTDKRSLPRASGGVSNYTLLTTLQNRSSPRKRGCFYGDLETAKLAEVFPAQAGVFLIRRAVN